MNKTEKTEVIEQLVAKLNANDKIYLADCSTLTVEKVNAFHHSFPQILLCHICKWYQHKDRLITECVPIVHHLLGI